LPQQTIQFNKVYLLLFVRGLGLRLWAMDKRYSVVVNINLFEGFGYESVH
jgi:hypothetical protein